MGSITAALSKDSFRAPGIDSFWEQADVDGSDDHPLERELGDRLDALARYRRLIDDATTAGLDDAVDQLIAQHAREEELVRRLTNAIRRMRDGGRDQGDDERN